MRDAHGHDMYMTARCDSSWVELHYKILRASKSQVFLDVPTNPLQAAQDVDDRPERPRRAPCSPR